MLMSSAGIVVLNFHDQGLRWHAWNASSHGKCQGHVPFQVAVKTAAHPL